MLARSPDPPQPFEQAPCLYTFAHASEQIANRTHDQSRREACRTPQSAGPMSGMLLRMLKWTKARGSRLRWLYTWVPFQWRLALRRRLHAATGTPIPPLPLSAERRARRADWAALPVVRPGVNILGYARGQFGVAESLRGYARALEESGYPFEIFNLDLGAASRQQDSSMERH